MFYHGSFPLTGSAVKFQFLLERSSGLMRPAFSLSMFNKVIAHRKQPTTDLDGIPCNVVEQRLLEIIGLVGLCWLHS